MLSQLELSGNGDWTARLSFHHQDLLTRETQTGESTSDVKNRALDIGFALENRWRLDEFNGQIGLDYFGRRNVNASQADRDLLTAATEFTQAIDDGTENETALFATVNRDMEFFSVHAGIRLTYFSQGEQQASRLSEDNDSYFITLRKPMGNWNLDLSYGTSTRFASLTERFFTGTTGRGRTIGNPDLTPEESSELDLGVSYQGDMLALELHRFQIDVENFIERIELADNSLSFSNLVAGEIDGWQYRLALFPSGQWQLELSGQGITGNSRNGMPLVDIPPKRHQMDIIFDSNRWSTRLSLRRQLEKNAFGQTEMPIDAANIGALRFNYTLNDRWQLQASVENLFDETYFSSADALSTLAIGREFMISIHYQ